MTPGNGDRPQASRHTRPKVSPDLTRDAAFEDDPDWLESAYRQGIDPRTWRLAEAAPEELTETYRKTGFVRELNKHFVGPDNRVYKRSPETEPNQTARERLGREARSAPFGAGSPVETITGIPEGGFKIRVKQSPAPTPGLPHGPNIMPRPTPRGGAASGSTLGSEADTVKPTPGRNSTAEAHRMANRWPELRMSADRQRSILEDTPAYFPIAENPEANSDAPFYAYSSAGAMAVRDNAAIIEEEARRVGVDPDLVRAIMYVERSHGDYGGIGRLFDHAGISKSVLPMNVRDSWTPLAGGNVDLMDVRQNVRVGATLLQRIQDRLPDPTIGKIASLYEFLGAETVGDYGARVEHVYRMKEWNLPRNFQPRR